jgi:hypothetical protein
VDQFVTTPRSPRHLPEDSPMKISYPLSEPAGFKTDKVFAITNYPAAGGVSASGSAYINRGVLLFKFYNFKDPVSIAIDLAKSGRGRLLAQDVIDMTPKGGDRFVMFEDFPTGYTRDNVYCYFELLLTNRTRDRKDMGTAVNVQMMFRA